jgi:hypothetical protein
VLLVTSNEHRTEVQQQTNKHEELKITHQIKGKLKKSILKERAPCYGHVNERNTENGARVEKKQLSKDLSYRRKQTTINFIYLFIKQM